MTGRRRERLLTGPAVGRQAWQLFRLTGQLPLGNARSLPLVSRRVSKVVKAAADGIPFEEALKKLESVVEAMESDELPLEQLLAKFEEGTRLVQVCQSRLAEAEVKVQKLEQDLAGEPGLRSATSGDPAAVAA